MKKNNPAKTSYLFCAMLLFLCSNSFAQKLPNIQTESVSIPSSLKIDGRLTEWNDLLQAYNKSMQIYYTIANNDQNLYLAIKSTDKEATGKILAGGVSFLINSSENKKEIGPSITFPVRDIKTQLDASSYLDPVRIPSLILQAKEMRVLNITGITDSLLSIYNTYNIKSSMTYDNGILIYELSIPLKFIGGPKNFSYKITLNGTGDSGRLLPGSANVPPPPPGLPPGRSPLSTGGMLLDMRYPTYLLGNYTLYGK